MRVIAFINQKGGVGKTATCHNVGAALASCGLDVLLVDLDPQGSLTQSAGLDDLTDEALTVYEVLAGADVNAAIQTKTTSTKYDVLPADIRLSAGEIELVNADRRNFLLRDALGRIRKQYDYILIDCPPSLNIFSLMALTAATEAIIPVQAQYLPLKGVAQLRDTINLVRQRFNPALKIAGVLLTFFDDRRTLDKDVQEALEQAFKSRVFNTKIRQYTKIAIAPSYGTDILSFSARSAAAAQYRLLAEEIREQETTEEAHRR